MYTASNVYGNAVTLQTVSMIERVVFVGIDTYYDFESIWTINSLESYKHPDRQLSTTRNQSVVTLSFFDCWQITVDVFFWLEARWYCISNADCETMVWRKRDECYSDGCIQVRDAWADHAPWCGIGLRFKHRPACSDQDFKVHIVRYWNSDIVIYYQLFCYYMAVKINKSILISFIIISLTLIWSVPEHISPGGITFTFVIKVITLIFSNIFEMTLTGGKPAFAYHYYIYILFVTSIDLIARYSIVQIKFSAVMRWWLTYQGFLRVL